MITQLFIQISWNFMNRWKFKDVYRVYQSRSLITTNHHHPYVTSLIYANTPWLVTMIAQFYNKNIVHSYKTKIVAQLPPVTFALPTWLTHVTLLYIIQSPYSFSYPNLFFISPTHHYTFFFTSLAASRVVLPIKTN